MLIKAVAPSWHDLSRQKSYATKQQPFSIYCEKFGLVMQDSSPFRWLEERGPACQLIAVIDDAASRFYARFTEHDTTEELSRTLGMVAAERLLRRCWGTVAGRKSPFAFRTSARGVGDRMDRGAPSAGERTDRATVRNAAGPLGICTGKPRSSLRIQTHQQSEMRKHRIQKRLSAPYS